MESITDQLSARFGAAFVALGLDATYGDVVVSSRPELAQFQCNGALAAAKPAGRKPRQLAEELLTTVDRGDVISDLSIAGPGFINITVADPHLAQLIDTMHGDERLGVPRIAEPKRVIVDYGGPNVAKALHVGHLRPAIIGETIKRTLAFVGHDVVGDVHLGDRGTPMGQLIALLAIERPDLPYFDESFTGPYPEESPVTEEDLETLYPEASSRAKEDPAFGAAARSAAVALQDGRPGYKALWTHFRTVSIESMKEIYDELNVHFEYWYGESQVHDRIAPMLEKLAANGASIVNDGAVIVDVTEPEDSSEIPPLLLVKGDGGYLYTTTDLATIDERVADMGAEVILYVVDARQSLHFVQVFRAARKGGIAPPEVVLEHDPFGTVNGPNGKPLKTRDGDLPALRGLLDDAVAKAAQRIEENELATNFDATERAEIARKVGIAALKYGDLSNHRTSDYIFDLDRFVSFEGKTGPYLLYGAVRIQSILRNATERGLAPGTVLAPTVDAERNLMLRLLRLEDTVTRTAEHRAPNHLAEYAYELTTDFNRFYEACHILNEEDAARQASWLGLVEVTLRTLQLLLDLLAIEIPERM